MEFNNKLKRFPIKFQTVEDENVDTRFTKVKIWLMHTNENLNGSYFDKSDVEAAFPTLANVPILGYIEVNNSGEQDYSDHRNVIEKKNKQWTITYKCSAYGVIPQDNNAHFESKMCSDGIEREFVVCDGLLWNKWDTPIEIMERDGEKSQSMELHDDYEGYFDENNVFHFTKFSFFGALILGKDFEPGMHDASIQVQFSIDDVLSEIKTQLYEYSKSNGINSTQNNGENLNTNFSQKGGTNVAEGKKDFSISAQELAKLFQDILEEEKYMDTWGYTYTRYWYIDHDDNLVYCHDSKESWVVVSFTYTRDGDVPVIDFNSRQLMKSTYSPVEGDTSQFSVVGKKFAERMQMAEDAKKNVESEFNTKLSEANQKVEEVTTKFNEVSTKLTETEAKATEAETKYTQATEQITAITNENLELKEFKKTVLVEKRTEQVNELFAKFSTQLTDEETSELKTQAMQSEEPLENYENTLFAMVGRKNIKSNFSAPTKKPNSVMIPVPNSDEPSDKPWAHLIKDSKK